MTDMEFYLTMAAAGLIGLAMLTAAMLAGWRGWLTLKQQQLANESRESETGPTTSPGARIEIADLKARIRKLEAIAAGVDL